MFKQILLKCLCAVIFLIISPKCSNCASSSVKNLTMHGLDTKPDRPRELVKFQVDAQDVTEIQESWEEPREMEPFSGKLPGPPIRPWPPRPGPATPKPHRPRPPRPGPWFPKLKMQAFQWNSKMDDQAYRKSPWSHDFSDDDIKKHKLWRGAVVPYFIDVESYSDKVLRDRIRSFLKNVPVVRFTELPKPPKDGDTTRWVFFVNRQGLRDCADHSIKNFTSTDFQIVNLGYECMSTGGELAEAVLAILGVPPQHNAPNRDEYIKVIEENILPEKKIFFEKLKDDEWFFHNISYDFYSAGHYHQHKYSVNGRATIETQSDYYGSPIGETTGLSNIDIQKIHILYGKQKNLHNFPVSKCHQLFIREPKSINKLNTPETNLGLPNENANYETEMEYIKYLPEYDTTGDEKNNSNNGGYNSINDDSEDNVENKDDEESRDFIEKAHVPSIQTGKLLKRPADIQVLKKQVKSNLPKRDPLSYLSDYHTGDDTYSKKVYNNVGVQYMKFGAKRPK